MTDTVNALTFAQSLLPLLPGWRLSARTERRIMEREDVHRYVSLSHPDYPLADVSIQTAREPGRVSISASYPENDRPWRDSRYVYSESITVSASKTPAVIARDIERRLFVATRYLTFCVEAAIKQADAEANQAKAAALTRQLAAGIGTATHYDGTKWEHEHGRDGYGGSRGRLGHLLTDENQRRFTAHADEHSSRVDVDVSYDGGHVNLSFASLDPVLATELLALWRANTESVTPIPVSERVEVSGYPPERGDDA